MLKPFSLSFTLTCAAALVTQSIAQASIQYVESGGVVVGEAEIFSNRIARASDGKSWLVVPDESAGSGTIINARGGKYIQSLPDATGGGAPNLPPEIHYEMLITTTGTYRLWTRWDGDPGNPTPGNADSLFADIIELKDGAGGTIADHYELTSTYVNGDFAAPTTWDGSGGFEQNQATASNSAILWTINTPGVYTLRYTMREDGSAIDAWAFQLANLAAPSGSGPTVSQIVPEPSTYLVFTGLFAAMGLAGWWRRRRKAG